ncbi:hypothetical protein B0H14DRAFT_2607757 [Mycena olivaceomarginata]|nr:hypothetical protein B0H14DRAFT_2607757 [Mycena olivaceomarginata]
MSESGFDSTVCTPEQRAISGASEFYCYTRRQNVGLVRNIIRTFKEKKGDRPALIQQPMDLFMLSLFFGDLFQSIGVVMDVRWINNGIVQGGDFCTAQGRHFLNIGQAAIAMSTFIITLHTFDTIWRRGGIGSPKLAAVIVGTIWTFLVLTVSISTAVHRSPRFYAPTPPIENFWLWIGFAVSVLYVPLLFWDTGHIIPGDPKWWTFKINTDAHSNHQLPKLKLTLLLLPAEAQFIVKGIFSLSGVLDVVAFKVARSGLLLFPSSDNPDETSSVASGNSHPTPEVSLHDDVKSTNSVDNLGWAWVLDVDNGAVLVCAWVLVNVLDAIWIIYYIRSATEPNPRTAANKSHAGWQAYYLMSRICNVFGFYWGCVNIVVWMWYFQSKYSPTRTQSGNSVVRSLRKWGSVVVLLPISVIMGLGPFFAPVVGIKLIQKQAWLHRCDLFSGEVVLNGLSFTSPRDATPVASFYFRQPNGNLEKQYDYGLTQDGTNQSLWHFALLPAFQPLIQIQSVTYDFDNFTFVSTCPGNTSQCSQGSFKDTGVLELSITDPFNSTIAHLRAVDKGWDYGKSDDAPSYILKQVEADGSLGNVVVRTAVTQPEHCNSLKLCANNADIATLAPVGLTLFRQNEYSKVCSTPNS